ncbi:MAG: cation:proton antiporter [Acidimicrobiales bacterium]|nr:cation:proton antiporter [Acidimicrobiales bacterium]
MEQDTIATLALIAIIAVLSPVLADLLRRFRIPGVVIEIVLGIIIGPQVLALATPDDIVTGLSELGLAFLMFLAGYEIELSEIKGKPLNRAAAGWGLSLVVAFTFAFVLIEVGEGLSTLMIGLALTTTALGTLLPIVRDAGILETRFGGYIMGIGTVGEFGPIVAIAVLLSGDAPIHTLILLAVFIGIAVLAAVLMLRARPPRWLELLRKNLHSSAQLPIRVSVLLIIALVWVAADLGLDVLLGAFAAGMILRMAAGGPDRETVRIKLEAIGFGFLIPIFFIVSGMKFDIDALLSDRSELIRVPMFLLAFLVVRGLPVLALYRDDLPGIQRNALALMAGTQLPLVVVITTIGLDTGQMLPSNAAALVGAAMLSVLLYPSIGLGLLKRAGVLPEPGATEGPTVAAAPDGA